MNTLIYSGRLNGKMVPNSNGRPGEHFEGAIGEYNTWLFGKAAEAARDLIGENVVASGLIKSRSSDKGNHFVSPNLFQLAPSTASPNVVLLQGTIVAVRRIKDGLYNADIEVAGKDFDRDTQKRIDVKWIVPVATGNVVESDIGRVVTVVGKLRIRDGKFVDIDPESFQLESAGELADLLADGAGDDVGADLAGLL